MQVHDQFESLIGSSPPRCASRRGQADQANIKQSNPLFGWADVGFDFGGLLESGEINGGDSCCNRSFVVNFILSIFGSRMTCS